MYHSTTILGRVGKEPEVRTINEARVAVFPVAVTETWKDKSGNKQENTTWYKCEVWGKLADMVQTHIHKGQTLLCAGTTKAEAYEKDGKQFAVLVLKVNEIKVANWNNESKSEPKPEPKPQVPKSLQDDDDLPF